MINNVIHLKYNEIPQLSSKDKMYQSADSAYDGFYKYSTDLESFKSVIENRKKFKTNRRVLVDVLLQQYQGTPSNDKILSTIKSLSDENTFTITTAHQPVLFMGPLYMVYKILSTIHLCRKLKAAYPTNSFVPVFVS
ncbi:MAG: bacillithiol biosynthesis BshC, partial [Saprospiraceae bacterium]|nr:bacillithiol biosynthesis BshC [Saprospiraceae bacterium]